MELRDYASLGFVGTLLVVGATAIAVSSAPAPSFGLAAAQFTEHVVDVGLNGWYASSPGIVSILTHQGDPTTP